MRHTFYVQYIFSSRIVFEIFSRHYAQILKLMYWTGSPFSCTQKRYTWVYLYCIKIKLFCSCNILL